VAERVAVIDCGRQLVLGVPIQACDLAAAAERVMAAARGRQPLGVACLAVHGVMTAVRDHDYRARLEGLELTLPDGQPVRWALNRLHGCGLPERVYGPHVMLELCRQAAAEGLPIYLFGTTPQTLGALERSLRERYPSLRIAGSQPSRFRALSEAEQQEDRARISASGARLVFAGLGCPRQEIWAYENRRELSMPCLAVGAAFDFIAGTQAQAPAWMQRRGLEWLFRLAHEPRRLWRRYLLLNPAFLALLGLELVGWRRRPAPLAAEPRPVRPG
jgi:N-acetylglucosaminyldiphosphoundecaprenol N-acetyl-beta-D-mannosaminyltransferase